MKGPSQKKKERKITPRSLTQDSSSAYTKESRVIQASFFGETRKVVSNSKNPISEKKRTFL